MLLGYTDAELSNMGGYDLVHYDDLAYVASAHQECKYISSLFITMLIAKILILTQIVSLSTGSHRVRDG